MKRLSQIAAILFFVVLLVLPALSLAQEKQTVKRPVKSPVARLREFCMTTPNDFELNVDLTQNPDRDYQRLLVKGDKIQFSLQSDNSDAYPYLFHVDAAGSVSRISSDSVFSKFRDSKTKIFPQSPAPISEPFGEEVVLAIATTRPLKTLDKSNSHIGMIPLDAATLDKFIEELRDQKNDPKIKLAADLLSITTFESPETRSEHKTKYILVAIGISKFMGLDAEKKPLPQKLQLNPIHCCHEDVRDLTTSLVEEQKIVDSQYSFVLEDEKATRERIRQLLTRKLPNVARDNDHIIIFYSSHGRLVASLSNKPQSYHLTTYDCDQFDSTTMISEDALSDWLDKTSYCKRLLMIDTCYSGAGLEEKDWEEFVDKKPSKGIKGANLGVLASCGKSQMSQFHKKIDSLMTHFVLNELNQQREYNASDLRKAIYPLVEEQSKQQISEAIANLKQKIKEGSNDRVALENKIKELKEWKPQTVIFAQNPRGGVFKINPIDPNKTIGEIEGKKRPE